MRRCLYLTLILFCCWLFAFDVDAATINAASCSKANVTTAYNAASNGDTIAIPAGDCSSGWSSPLQIAKQVTIQGAGVDQTYIGSKGFQIMANNVRITRITFDCKWSNDDAVGMVTTGLSNGSGCGTNPQYGFSDFRIDHNKFVHCGRQAEVLGYRAVGTFGPAYGVIDNNTFIDCNGECISIEQGGTSSLLLSNEPGQYSTNRTVYIEDNTFTYTTANEYTVDNVVDCNAGARYVFRYNTINLNSGAGMAGMTSMHDCSTGQNCNGPDNAEPQLAEVYGNNVYCNSTADLSEFLTQRSGRAFVYNNTVYYKDISRQVRLYHLRSGHRGSCCPCYDSFTEFCHEGEKGEGISANKTTLNGALGNDNGCPTMSSVTGFPTYGGSIIVGSEQIDYTAISGNTLTPCTRGANSTIRASHFNGSSVSLLLFGVCEGQPEDSYYWNNGYKATPGGALQVRNTVLVDAQYTNVPNYESYDIKSYSQRPQNYQYRNDGTAHSYTPYIYPHPLRNEGPPDTQAPTVPTNLSASAISSSQINLSWTASTDNVGVTGYKIYRCQGSGCMPSTQTGTSGTNTYSDTGLSGSTAYVYRVSAYDAAGNTSTQSNTASATTQAPSPTITIGETNILSINDSGNANVLIAQSASLSQSATIQSLSFYVTTASGKLRLGVYDSTGPGGGPGQKKAETAEITPTTGWNTANVITPVSLSPGTYWLAYLPSDNNLHFRRAGSGTAKYYSYTYGILPNTFSTTPTSTADHWSFYATLNTSADTKPPDPPTGLSIQ